MLQRRLHAPQRAHPQVPHRLPRLRVERVHRVHGAEVQRPILRHDGSQLRWDPVAHGTDEVQLRLQSFRSRHGRHGDLVLRARFLAVERRRHVENGASVLDRCYATGGEAAAVAEPVHEIDHRRGQVARQDEVAVHAVDRPGVLHRASGRHHRLGEDLSAEYAAGPDVAVLSAIDVVLEGLQLQQPHQVFRSEVGHDPRALV